MTAFVATYRLQLGPGLDFGSVHALVPYLRALGVSHLYLSPIMQARAGSTHGYDVVDPTRVSDALGGEAALLELAADAHADGLNLLVDIVPNHMAAVDDNPFWSDHRDEYFDIDPQTGRHRRFFDVDELAGVRVEDPVVFAATHERILDLVGRGVVQGVRVDHIDGLARPGEYLERLRAAGVAHVWVEKILEPGEAMPRWPVEGTTGYEFMNDALALFVDPAGKSLLTALVREPRSFADVAQEAQLEQARTTFAPECDWLFRLAPVADIDVALAALPVYRTYIDPATGALRDGDEKYLDTLPGAVRDRLARAEPAEFVTRFQQTSGAVMAKGVEDTACYRYVRLLALNEVGGDPDRFGITVDEFHAAARERAERAPRTLLAGQTHDTKRSLDVRSRLAVLASLASHWESTVQTWHEITAPLRISPDAPDWPEEMLLFQTLVGAWPITEDRLAQYVRKALREMKRNTNWVEPNEVWEDAVVGFAKALTRDSAFVGSLESFVAEIAPWAEVVSLGQVVLRFTTPGVPDIYQGDELWDLSLVDPDNRRAVDWDMRRRLLDAIEHGAVPTRANAKLFVTRVLLDLRRRHSDAFECGPYEPLDPDDASLCAFARGDIVVAVPTRLTSSTFDPGDGWHDLLAPLADIYGYPLPGVWERNGST